MRRITLFLLFIILWVSLSAQTGSFTTHNTFLSGRVVYSLEKQLISELYELQILEEEIARLNNILYLRSAIQELYSTGNLMEIEKAFNKRNQDLHRFLQNNQLRASALALEEQTILFGAIPQLHDQLVFNQARLAFQNKQLEESADYLSEIIKNTDSSILKEAVLLLAQVYFKQQKDEKFVNLLLSHQIEKDDDLTFQYANALFNLENYSAAGIEFETLLTSKEYGFRSQCLIALVDYFSGYSEQAKQRLNELSQTKNLHQRERNFLLINLGHIYLLENSFPEASVYFQALVQKNDDLSDEILYEIANYYFENHKYEYAQEYLKKILNKTEKSKFYASAKFLLSISELMPAEISEVQPAVDSLMLSNLTLLEEVSTKNYFLEKYSELQRKITQMDSTNLMYENINHQLDLINWELAETNVMLHHFYQGSRQRQMDKLFILEEEYKNYSSIMADIEALILIARQMPRQRFAGFLQREISFIDSSLITLQVMEYLQAKPLITSADYKMARNIAAEKILLASQLQDWQKIQAISEAGNQQQLSQKIAFFISILEANGEAYDRIADYLFGYSESPDYSEQINREVAALEKSRDELLDLKADIADSFDNLVSRKLEQQNNLLSADFANLKQQYNQMIANIEQDINLENSQYKFELLEFLFKYSLKMDQEYEMLQQRLRNEE